MVASSHSLLASCTDGRWMQQSSDCNFEPADDLRLPPFIWCFRCTQAVRIGRSSFSQTVDRGHALPFTSLSTWPGDRLAAKPLTAHQQPAMPPICSRGRS
eukprot:UN2498